MGEILHLTLKKAPFNLMVTGKKGFEFRKASNWIASRLVGKHYTHVKFVNGYGADKPFFIAEYIGYRICKRRFTARYPGLNVSVKRGDFIIILGEVTKIGHFDIVKP